MTVWGGARARLAVLAALFAVVGLSCRCGTDSPGSAHEAVSVELTTLRIVERAAPDTPGASLETLEARARERLPVGLVLAQGSEVPERPDAPVGWRATLGLGFLVGRTDGAVEVHLSVELGLTDRTGTEVPAQRFSFARTVNDPNDGALDRAREGLVDEALEAVGERLAVLTSPLPKVVESLRSPSVGERLAAIDRLTSDGARVAVPALRQALRAEQVAEVKLRLVGALGELGDPRAVEDLVAVADTRDIELLVAVLDALVVLGGERATEFLALLSTHDAPEIRALVEHARLRLERRVARPRPTERAVDAGGREVE